MWIKIKRDLFNMDNIKRIHCVKDIDENLVCSHKLRVVCFSNEFSFHYKNEMDLKYEFEKIKEMLPGINIDLYDDTIEVIPSET